MVLELARPSEARCFPPGGDFFEAVLLQQPQAKGSQKHHFLSVSDVTLGIFGVQFWGFSVLHCHGVFPSGDQQQQQATEAVEKCCFSRISDDTLGSFLAWFWN